MIHRDGSIRLARFTFFALVAVVATAAVLPAQEHQRVEFTRLIAHWDAYGTDDYVPFIAEAKPDIAQVGFYGAHFWSLAHTPSYAGYPSHFPLQGLNECGDWFTRLNAQLHGHEVQVVGHFNVKFLVGDPDSPEGPRGFFKFYRDLWNEAELGKKPVEDPLELLERDAEGNPIANKMYSIGGMAEYWGCLNNPHWRAVLKAWTRRGIERGVDGYVINYFYRHNCLCEHCRKEFHDYLAERYKPEELNSRFGIADLSQHRFDEIVSWHDPKESTPLRREMLRFSQVANKRAFDDVFIDYGRSLKPELIVAQWDHLGNFHQVSGDERCLLPAELWGKGEDYLWYSTGGAAYFTELAQGNLGEGTLQARYIRGAFDDKPFTLGKYEQTRIRATIAELAANGGAPMGFYARFSDPLARQEIVRYYGFMRQHDNLYRANRPHAEVLLVYPRTRVHQGDVAAVEEFKKLGKWLLDNHVLFDVRPDDIVSADTASVYRHLIRVGEGAASAELPLLSDDQRKQLSRFEAPNTVRVSASRPAKADDLTVHFVNYNRQEPEQPQSAGTGIADEKPIAADGIVANVLLPEGKRAARVEFLTPEAAEPVVLSPQPEEGRLTVTVPEFLVYGVLRITLE